MDMFLNAAAAVGAAVLAGAVGLTLLPRLGRPGRFLADVCARAPMLDIVFAALSWGPWLVAGLAAGWPGVAGALVGQVVAVLLWTAGHELAHPGARRGSRLYKAHHRVVGTWRNHAALWFSIGAIVPLWGVRFGEVLLYAPLQWLLGFPAYRHGDWVMVSRHKFSGLVGHDLFWCLWCDWMTGVYSLAGEMLRNVESFWCPIRFYDLKKCENCRVDFPDIDTWVPADGTMAEAEDIILRFYADGRREWFGHPARLTVEGQRPSSRD